ncbi:ankyrin repeat-containing protein [Tanacetum coccineum]
MFHFIAIDIRQLGVQEDDSLNAKLEKKLCMVALEGHWWKAKAIFNKYKDAATNPISDNGNTLLHIVQNSNGETTLQVAAIVDNKELVKTIEGTMFGEWSKVKVVSIVMGEGGNQEVL